MYNRYVPGHDGNYRRHTVHDTPLPCPPQQQQAPSAPSQTCEERSEPQRLRKCVSQRGAGNLDLGDLLLLCIIVLLLLDSDDEDMVPILITAAAFLFAQ